MTVDIKPTANLPRLHNPILIVGLPGIGNVGKITVDFIIDKLNAKKIYDINTNYISFVYINEEIKVKPDSSGHFFTRINLPVGETEIGIKSTNRFSRSSSKILKITIISK